MNEGRSDVGKDGGVEGAIAPSIASIATSQIGRNGDRGEGRSTNSRLRRSDRVQKNEEHLQSHTTNMQQLHSFESLAFIVQTLLRCLGFLRLQHLLDQTLNRSSPK